MTALLEERVGVAVCPVHQQTVAYQPGFLVGRCDGCCAEVALALAWLKKHPRRAA